MIHVIVFHIVNINYICVAVKKFKRKKKWFKKKKKRKTKVPKKTSVDEKTGKNNVMRFICEFGVTMKLFIYLKVSSIEYFPKKTIQK